MSEIDQQVEIESICFICGDMIPTADVVDFCLLHSSSCCSNNSAVCADCFKNYLHNLIGTGFHGFCPPIKCPASHARQDQHLIAFDKWKHYVDYEILMKYSKMAESVLEILCGSCHRSKTTLVKFVEQNELHNTHESLSKYIDTESGHTIDNFLEDISKNCTGEMTADELYAKLLVLFPMLNSCDDESAWELINQVLSLIENPERRATIQLRHFKARPNIKTLCCNCSHCWNCKTVLHPHKTCEQNSDKLDNRVLPCPKCGVSLTKSDGCSSVTCFCGYHFNWTKEINRVVEAGAFLAKFPENTTQRCVDILTNSTDQSDIRLAKAWIDKHVIDVNKGLLEWWKRSYRHCAAQAVAVPDHEGISKFIGRKHALELYKQNDRQTVMKCISEDTKVLSTFFVSMFPNENERLQMALLITTGGSSGSRNNGAAAFTSIPLLKKSARWWLQANPQREKLAKSQLCENRIKSVLYLFGKTNPWKFFDIPTQHTPASMSFMDDNSCSSSSLVYSNDNKTATRPGGVSCYPAAFVRILSSNCRIAFEVSNCAYSVNFMSFGLCTSSFPSSSSDGFGKNRDTWGICDNRNSSNASEPAWVGANGQRHATMRKLEEGDRVTLRISGDEHNFEVILNNYEFHHIWKVDVNDDNFKDFRFGVTFANDHCVTIVDDDNIGMPNVTDSWMNPERFAMIQRVIDSMNDIYLSKFAMSNYLISLAVKFDFESPMTTQEIVDLCLQIEGILNGERFTFSKLIKKILTRFELHLENFFGLICWMRHRHGLLETHFNGMLALEHLETHGDSSAFAAACIHHEQQNKGESREYKAAVAYMRTFSDETQAWYIYNNELEDPILPKHAELCECLPRCYKKCIHQIHESIPIPTQKEMAQISAEIGYLDLIRHEDEGRSSRFPWRSASGNAHMVDIDSDADDIPPSIIDSDSDSDSDSDWNGLVNYLRRGATLPDAIHPAFTLRQEVPQSPSANRRVRLNPRRRRARRRALQQNVDTYM